MTRRSLFQRTAAAFAGSLLARLPFVAAPVAAAGPIAQPPGTAGAGGPFALNAGTGAACRDHWSYDAKENSFSQTQLAQLALPGGFVYCKDFA